MVSLNLGQRRPRGNRRSVSKAKEAQAKTYLYLSTKSDPCWYINANVVKDGVVEYLLNDQRSKRIVNRAVELYSIVPTRRPLQCRGVVPVCMFIASLGHEGYACSRLERFFHVIVLNVQTISTVLVVLRSLNLFHIIDKALEDSISIMYNVTTHIILQYIVLNVP